LIRVLVTARWFSVGVAATRVKLAMRLFEYVLAYMRIDLSCSDVCVAQQFLHRAQIRAALKEVRRK
jgi:hypothetical protein